MTTENAQTHEEPSAGATMPLAQGRGMLSAAMNTTALTPAPAVSSFARSASHWIHQHSNMPNTWTGYTGYQLVRGVASAIPYGISMALTLGGMVGLERWGDNIAKKAAQESVKAGFGKRLAEFAKFPAVRSSMMIATSFTLYRSTGRLVKWANDWLLNAKDTEEQTAHKIEHFREDLWKKMKNNASAEWASTPVAAFALGFVNATFTKGNVAQLPLQKGAPLLTAKEIEDGARVSLDFTRKNYEAAKKIGKHGTLLKEVLTNPKARFLEQASIFSLGYALFFEMADRLFKDRQIAEGKWKGDHSSTNPAQHEGKDAAAKGELPAPKHYGFFTNETSVGRFAFRRLVPTTLAIFPYTAFKFRHAYMQLGDLAVKEKKNIWPQMSKLSAIEIGAVMWFILIPYIAEKWEKGYDTFFAKLERNAGPHDEAQPIVATTGKPPEIAKVAALPAPALDASAAPTSKVGEVRRDGVALQQSEPARATA